MRDLGWIDDECRRLLADSGADQDEAEGLRHWLRRIEEVTAIPADKRADVDHMRAAVMLARSYASAGLLSESPEEGLGPDGGETLADKVEGAGS